MVWINYQCHNYSVPKGVIGGAICMCLDCRKKRGEKVPEWSEREKEIDDLLERIRKSEIIDIDSVKVIRPRKKKLFDRLNLFKKIFR